VDVEITTPDGRRMTRELSEIPGAAYMELKEEFGHTRATVEIPFPSKGVYAIKVIPKEDALPSDTFTLELRQGEMIAALIEDQKVSEIPQTPLLLSVAPVDIRPDATENIVNLRSQGVLPVAILSTQLFDATDVDVTTVRFGPGGAVEAHGRGHLEDVNGDGKVDLVLHFRVQETGLPSGATEACLVGRTLNGVPIMGCDSVKTLPSR